jgi:uncharacterized RDD family membrane protein YckC
METDWDSTLRAISLSRAAYLFYALIKVAAYSTVVFVLLSFAELFSGISYLLQPGQIYILLISVIIVLLFTWRSLGEGFRRMQSLDALFWDLRVFSTEFKRAEFNKT